MTVSSSVNKVTYSGNSATLIFPVNYYFLENSHLQVILVSNNVETIQTITSQYTVTGAGNPAGGSVTMVTAPPTGTQLIIVRNVPATQETDYLANDPFPAESHERALDKLTMLVQQVELDADRALKIPLSSLATTSTELPVPSANKLLAWNSNASAITNFDPASVISIVGQQASFSNVFTGNGVTVNFTLDRTPGNANAVDVSINGVTQVPNVDYVLNGDILTFTTAPPQVASQILARYTEVFAEPNGDAANVRYLPAGSGAVATNVQAKLRETVSVKDFGAVGDGVADDTVAIQAAIDYVEGNGGGSIYLPSGVYKLNSGLTISRGGVNLYGDGCEEFVGAFGSTVPQVRGNGTWLYWDFLSTSLITLATSTSNGVIISKIGFDCPKPTIAPGWTPPNQGPAINVLAGPCVLEDLYFFGVSRGIQIGSIGASTGRATLSRIKGEFFVFGVDIVFSADVVRINDYHQYPFWSIFASGPVRDYQTANTYGIRSARNDNAQLSNVFIGGVYRGLYIYSTTDGTTNELMVSNMDCDFTDTGYIFDANFATASFANIGSQPGPDATLTDSTSFFVAGDQNRIRITNFRSARTNKESIQIGGANNFVSIVNYDVNNWDDQQSGLRGAIRSDSATNTITLSGGVYYAHAAPSLAGPLLTGSLASYKWVNFAGKEENLTTDGSGDATVTHNLGFAPNAITVQLKTLFDFICMPHTITSTTFKVRVITASTGLPATASAIQFDWKTSM
jgi:hypothetical protein